MAQSGKSTVTPKLRFPEFLKDANWERKALAEVCDRITQGGTPDTSNPAYWNGHIHWLTPAEMGKDETPFVSSTARTITDLGLANCSSELLPINSVIISTRAPIGHLAINTVPIAINQGCKGLVARPLIDYAFLFSSLLLAKPQLIDLGAGNTFKELSGSALKRFPILCPSLSEQHKIASCLTSLDEVIVAHRRKVDALTAHRQALLQQLFPRDGETLPSIRFPEFSGRPAWNVVPLGSVLTSNPEYGVNEPAVAYSEQLPTYLRITDIGEDGRLIAGGKVSVNIAPLDEAYLSDGDIVLARTGASVGKSYRYRMEDGRLVFAGFLIRIRPNRKKIVPAFLSSFLATGQYWNWVRATSARSGQPGINGTEYAALPVPLPPPSSTNDELTEQRRIADGLSAIEDQIVAELKLIGSLKTHKKGLMQQVFPSSEDGA
jgi:type I restriction enzyme S subunit